MAPVSCVSCVSWSHQLNAAETYETAHVESGMRYQIRHFEPDPRSDRALPHARRGGLVAIRRLDLGSDRAFSHPAA